MPKTLLTAEEKRERENARGRRFLNNHPEKRTEYRITAAVNLLRRNGWTVTAPAREGAAQ